MRLRGTSRSPTHSPRTTMASQSNATGAGWQAGNGDADSPLELVHVLARARTLRASTSPGPSRSAFPFTIDTAQRFDDLLLDTEALDELMGQQPRQCGHSGPGPSNSSCFLDHVISANGSPGPHFGPLDEAGDVHWGTGCAGGGLLPEGAGEAEAFAAPLALWPLPPCHSTPSPLPPPVWIIPIVMTLCDGVNERRGRPSIQYRYNILPLFY